MKVAMCIPTLNRANVVDDTLGKGIEGYQKYGIDLYYYDISEGNETKEVVERYIDKGYKNITYIKCDKEERMQMLYSCNKGDKVYDYIWPVKDRVWFEEPTLKAVIEAMEYGYDAIFLGVLWSYGTPNVGSKVYEKPEQFYYDWGYLSTSIDVNIFKADTMLFDLSKEGIAKLYPSFIHFQIMFERLAIGKKTVKTLVGNDIIAYNSNLVRSGWKKTAFETWEDEWIKVNEALPDCYNEYKNAVIMHAGKLPWIFGDVNTLIDLKNEGILSEEKLKVILPNWERVSPISKEKLIAIAKGVYDKRHDLDLVNRHLDEFLNLLVQMSNFVLDGKMAKEQIPYDDVFQGVMNKIVKKYQNDMNMVNVVAGSVEDTLLFIRDKAKTNEEIERGFQMLISITIAAM